MKLSLLLPLAAATFANPSSGKLSIEIDHINTEVLTPACHDILVEAFDMAYQEVHGVKDMTNSFDTYVASPAYDLSASWGSNGWWKYMYYPEWTCGRWGDDEIDPQVMLRNNTQLESAMTSLVRASTCADFQNVTAIKMVDHAPFKRNVKVPAMIETSRKVNIEVDHINNKELTSACHDILVDAFNMAYKDVYGVNDMKNSFETYGAVPEKSLSTFVQGGGWWKFYYFPDWASLRIVNNVALHVSRHNTDTDSLERHFRSCGIWCDDEIDPPVKIQSSNQHPQFESVMTALVRASNCEAFQDVAAIKIVDAATVANIRDAVAKMKQALYRRNSLFDLLIPLGA